MTQQEFKFHKKLSRKLKFMRKKWFEGKERNKEMLKLLDSVTNDLDNFYHQRITHEEFLVWGNLYIGGEEV